MRGCSFVDDWSSFTKSSALISRAVGMEDAWPEAGVIEKVVIAARMSADWIHDCGILM